MIIGTSVASAACGLGFLDARNTVEVHVVAVICGSFGGFFFALLPTVLARLTADVSLLRTKFGTASTVLSIAIAMLFNQRIASEYWRVSRFPGLDRRDIVHRSLHHVCI